jgi:hypothetical protein
MNNEQRKQWIIDRIVNTNIVKRREMQALTIACWSDDDDDTI